MREGEEEEEEDKEKEEGANVPRSAAAVCWTAAAAITAATPFEVM